MTATIVTCPKCGAKNRVDDRADQLQPVCGRCGARLPTAAAAAEPVTVTDANFSSVVLGAAAPVLVDCWAAWCGPCRMIAPTIEQIAAESAGRWTVGKLDVDQNPRTASQFQIASIPTLLIFSHGQLVDRLVGLQPKAAILEHLSRAAH